jgi:hypothetical protein
VEFRSLLWEDGLDSVFRRAMSPLFISLKSLLGEFGLLPPQRL